MYRIGMWRTGDYYGIVYQMNSCFIGYLKNVSLSNVARWNNPGYDMNNILIL